MNKISAAPAPPAPVRKEFPETWLWQTIAPKRLDLVLNDLDFTSECSLIACGQYVYKMFC